jgi:hypothetical protein
MITSLISTLLLVGVIPDTVRFAQGVEYRLEARLDETTDLLHGRGELRYTNNAPIALDTLWMHQHLNAFRPNSAWARREQEFGNARFQQLGPEDHGFERLTSVLADGRPVHPVYPGSPDSTVLGLPLPRALEPGGTVTLRFDWTARLSTTPRRQGREERQYDWAHWYPRIAVFGPAGWEVQPLLPQGEFFGEFSSYDVVLDLAADQVVGATGVPVEGDPGWEARSVGPFDERLLQRESFAATPRPDLGLVGAPGEGRKVVRWRARDVHHFGWSVSPEYVYEGGWAERSGSADPIAIHVLYRPHDGGWAGIALDRTRRALDWLQEMFGPYAWPQLTNLRRIEGGGTEFPMMMMNGSPSEGLIVHEAAHQYLHGILANNEFTEGWLDEGFASFITNWYLEERGEANVWDESIAALRRWELTGRTQPVGLPAAEFRDFNTYAAMTYTKADLVFRMLRWLIGEPAMRDAIRLYYERHALQHVREADLRRAVNDAAGEDLDWFFDQWIHTTATLDYAITQAHATRRADGSWVTQVEVTRAGDAWMPTTLEVGEVTRRLESRERRQVVEVVTRERPVYAVLDPENVLLDFDTTNNRAVVTVR